MLKSLKEILERTRKVDVVVAVAGGDDDDILKALLKAKEIGIAKPILVGNKIRILDCANSVGINDYDIVECLKGEESQVAVSLALEGKANLIMKGGVSTSSLLKAVLDKDKGLRRGNLLSHVAVFEIPGINRLLILTDGGMNISPTLKEKVDILLNALEVTRVLDIEMPKVAVLAAVEVVSENMPATIDAAILSKMNERGQLKGCIIDGPLALDCALSKEAAEHKGIKSKVAGEADVLLVPDIEAGNILGKSFTFVANGVMAGVVLGANKPIVLSSRADSPLSKLVSLSLGVLIAMKKDSFDGE